MSDDNLSARASARISAAEDPDERPETLARLSSHPDIRVRIAVALNPSTPVEVLAEMSSDSDIGVMSAVARNRATPPEILDELGDSPIADVSLSVAYNPSTSPETIRRMFAQAESQFTLSFALVGNPSTPSDIISAFPAFGISLVTMCAIETMNMRICELLGIDGSNEAALEMLRAQEWWLMDKGHESVILALELSPDPTRS